MAGYRSLAGHAGRYLCVRKRASYDAGQFEPVRGAPVHAISRGEWRWVAWSAAVLAGLAALPYAVALLRPPDGYQLARTLYYGNDLSQYLAAMGDGRSSAWLVQDHLTAEPHSPALMYTFYVLLGKLAGLLGAQPVHLFAGAMLAAAPALVFSAYAFVATFTPSVSERRLALLFVLASSGLGIWVAALSTPAAQAEAATLGFSYDRAEVATFLLPFGPPHLPLALAALLLWGRHFIEWSRSPRPRAMAAMLLLVLAVALLNPFSLATLVGLAAGLTLLRWAATRRFPALEVVAAVASAAVAGPLLLANILTFSADPFWSVAYGQQNLTGSPPPGVLALDLGLLLPFALAGALSPKLRREPLLFLVAWIATLLVLMYLPVPFQRRFGFGLQPALAALAALGAVRSAELLKERTPSLLARLAFRGGVAVLVFSGTLLGYLVLLLTSTGAGPLGRTVFEPAGNVAATDWLAANSGERDVVLASFETGNYLAGRIRGRIVAGHKAGTLDWRKKQELIAAFYSPATPAGDRLRIASEAGATLVLVGTRERALGGGSLRAEDGFRLLYDERGVRVYRVERPFSGTNTLSIGPLNASFHAPLAASRTEAWPSFGIRTASTP